MVFDPLTYHFKFPPSPSFSSSARDLCFQAKDGIRDRNVTGVQTCALPISVKDHHAPRNPRYTPGRMRVLVTGAASGIGRATCLRLARDARARGQAAKIAAVDVAPLRELDGLREELRKLDAEALPLRGDMGGDEGPARVV